jgi:hypothetical protein
MVTDLAIFTVPGGALEEFPIQINVTAIVEKEQRLDDVARVNSHTAPELLTTFNRCWLDLDKLCVALSDAKNKAKQAIDQIEFQLTLECTDEALKLAGHTKASADLRKAWVGANGKLNQAKSRLIEISTVLDYMRGKQKAFENGYQSVKKLINSQLPIDSNPGKMPEPFVNSGTRIVNPGTVNVNNGNRPKPVPIDEVIEMLGDGLEDELPAGFGKLKL